jgi:hypothetical protein
VGDTRCRMQDAGYGIKGLKGRQIKENYVKSKKVAWRRNKILKKC